MTSANLTDLIAEHGTVPPPWAMFPEFHPASMGWRVGHGEDYMTLWYEWWQSRGWSEAQQIAYLQAFQPPNAWLQRVIFWLWPDAEAAFWAVCEEESEQAAQRQLQPYFARLEALGFGSFEDWRTADEQEDWQ